MQLGVNSSTKDLSLCRCLVPNYLTAYAFTDWAINKNAF